MTQRFIVQCILNDAARLGNPQAVQVLDLGDDYGPAHDDEAADGSRILKYNVLCWPENVVLGAKVRLLATPGVKKVYMSPDECKLCVKFKEPISGSAHILDKLRAYVAEDDNEYTVLELAQIILDRVKDDLA